jgi:hypothetical protein
MIGSKGANKKSDRVNPLLLEFICLLYPTASLLFWSLLIFIKQEENKDIVILGGINRIHGLIWIFISGTRNTYRG